MNYYYVTYEGSDSKGVTFRDDTGFKGTELSLIEFLQRRELILLNCIPITENTYNICRNKTIWK